MNRSGRVRLTSGLLLAVLLATLNIGLVSAAQPGNAAFQRTWERTDRPVLDGLAARTWMWGPEAFTGVLSEPYAEAPGGARAVQYFDKARMEITDPDADQSSVWYVTNGLLVVELMTGNMQTGHNRFEPGNPAMVNVAGDFDDPAGVTYAALGGLQDASPAAVGEVITSRVNRPGQVTSDPALASQGVTVALVDDVTNHAIAAPFWEFMTSSGTVYAGGQFATEPLFENAYFATGRPVTEAYWADVKVAGSQRLVLLQCFERRCLTYTPGNPEGFVVEAGNVGQHYYAWRYADGADPAPQPEPEPSPEPDPTPDPEPEPQPTPTPDPEPEPMPDPATSYTFAGAFGQALEGAQPFSSPTGVAAAPNGNVYVVDGTDQVRVFTPDGVWIKSWGGPGAEPGKFDSPQGIAVDPDGFVYVADFANHRIQKFDPDGALITHWVVDGFPSDVAYSPTGHIYVTDMNKHMVRIYDTNGNPAVGWGEWGSEPGQFFAPAGIAVGPDSNVYVADTVNNRVQVFSLTGEFRGMFGSKGSGAGQFNFPSDIVIVPGQIVADFKVYVADSLNDRIQIFSREPELAPAADRALAAVTFSYSGSLGETGSEGGQFAKPEGLDLDPHGNLLVADLRNDRVQRIAPDGRHLDSWKNATRGRFESAIDFAVGLDGRVYALDASIQTSTSPGDVRIEVFGVDGKFQAQWRGMLPGGITTDNQGNLIVFSNATGRIEKYSPDGEFLEGWGSAETQPRTIMSFPELAVDSEDNLFILYGALGGIQKFSADGIYLGSWGAPGSQPGQLLGASELAIHGDEVYVVEAGNHRVSVFDLDGKFLRMWGTEGSADGQFRSPQGIAVDAYGYVYVGDRENHRVQKFTPQGEFIAKWGTEGSGDGQLRNPSDVQVDPSGDVYVLDFYNYRIQVFRPVN